MSYPIAFATDERRRELRAMPYCDYLRTPEWQQVRWCALNEGDYRMRGSESLADVVVLCDGCHERHHGTMVATRVATEISVRGRTVPLRVDDADAEMLEILSLRARGEDVAADELTRRREARWRDLARGAA